MAESNDDRKVTVCAACRTARCHFGRKLCNKSGETVELTVAELRVLGLEHKSWWKPGAGESEDPRDAEDVRDVAEWAKSKGDDPQMFASYLIGYCGLSRAMCKRELAQVWPAAALFIEVEPINVYRDLMVARDDRAHVVALLNGAAQSAKLTPSEADGLLQEWDALKVPRQVPEPVRKAALERLNRALGLEAVNECV